MLTHVNAQGSQLAAPFRLPHSPAKTDLVAKYFRGLGDPTRLRILELLRESRELSVGELVERLGVSQPKVSNHLACLRWCGFVETRREHRVVYNRIADRRVAKMLDLARALLDENDEHVAACCRIDER
jgi:ArsR family transcriptional regulator, cadmium/lead-responsive transcriptional repressor